MTISRGFVIAALTFALLSAAPAAKKEKRAEQPQGPFPMAVLEGGRKLDFLRTVSSEQELHTKRSFFNKLVDVIAGAPEWHKLVRPYEMTTDSRGRLLITDPGAMAVHIFDFEKNKYTFIAGGKKDTFQSPIGIAVDADDNIYVTDSRLGKILVFDAKGKYRRTLGDIKGEGFYKRPTGIAIDKSSRRMYVTDTLRNRVFITDLDGKVIKDFGSHGAEAGQFNFPTEVFVRGDDVFVVDAMNFRVQIFNKEGVFQTQFGQLGSGSGSFYRPKGLGVDSQGDIYIVDASMEMVQVFDRAGRLLYVFGRTGTKAGEFELPSGLWVDAQNRIYVADSYNHRVQVFQFTAPAQSGGGQH